MNDFENIKPGDEVVYDPGGTSTAHYLRKVDRVTPSQIIIGDTRFNRKSGEQIGGDYKWGRPSIHQQTPELLEKVEKTRRIELTRQMRYKVESALKNLTLEQLQRIDRVVSEGQEGGNRLIAKAPDMFDACKLALRHIEMTGDGVSPDEQTVKVALRAVIAEIEEG